MAGKQYKFKATGGAGAVSSVFGRTGAVTAQAGDYAAFYQSVPISKTVAQMQALAGSFIPGQVYKITDQTYFPSGLYVAAFNADELFVNGNGAFINGAMASYVMAEVGYELITDSVTSVYVDHLQDGTKTGVFITDTGYGAVAAWPFDSALISQVEAINPLVAGGMTGTISGVKAGAGVSFSCDATSMIANVVKGANGQLAAADPGGSPGLIADCTIGNNTVVTASGWQISNSTIGDGKQVDTSSLTPGGSISNAVWIGDYNTIPISNADTADNALDMASNAGIIDFVNFAFAGILKITADVGLTKVITISNPPSHKFKLCNDGTNAGLIISDVLNTATNIYLEVGGVDITIDNTYAAGIEFLELKYDGTANCFQQSAMIRI